MTGLMKGSKPKNMTNQALQELIGSWFPNPEADKVSDVVEVAENAESSEEKPATTRTK